jgi:hypothetical protein
MPTVLDLIRTHLLLGVTTPLPDLDILLRSQRSPEFEYHCIMRKVLGVMRYGRMHTPPKSRRDSVGSMIRRLQKYQKDSNAEHLIDVANLCEVEFVEAGKEIIPIDDGEHVREK